MQTLYTKIWNQQTTIILQFSALYSVQITV
jgi:hypothetical protein